GLAVPIGSLAQRPSGSTNGTLRYNTDNATLEAYLAGSWQDIPALPHGSGFLSTGGGTIIGDLTVQGKLFSDGWYITNLNMTGGGQYPGVDGNLISNVNAVKLQARNVSVSAPVGGQVLGWNSATSVWEPMSTAVGSVTSVIAGPGLLGGNITSSGSLYVDTGT